MPTAAGPVQVDVLEVSDADLSPLPDDPTDRLHVLSHDWAAATATKVIICAGADRHAKLWFTDKAARTGRLVRKLPQGADVDPT